MLRLAASEQASASLLQHCNGDHGARQFATVWANAGYHRLSDAEKAGALVTRVVFDGKRAVGVEFLRDSKSHRIAARCEIVLSLGAINTPRVLMQSGIGDESELTRASVEVVQHLPGVGRNFTDHILVPCVWEYRAPPAVSE